MIGSVFTENYSEKEIFQRQKRKRQRGLMKALSKRQLPNQPWGKSFTALDA
jgi:hypothetical protein